MTETLAIGILLIAVVGALWRPLRTEDWMWTMGAAVVVLVGGLLSLSDAGSTIATVTPVLAFLVGVAVVAELSSQAGVFDHAAARLARVTGGRNWVLFLAVALLTAFATSIFSLDGAVVVMTPVVVHLSRMTGVPLLPNAFVVIFVANCGSLFFPVSNLTNLLAVQQRGQSFGDYTAAMWLPATLTLVTAIGVVWLWFHRQLFSQFTATSAQPVQDSFLLKFCAVVCGVMLPAFFLVGILGLGVEWVALLAAALVGGAFLVRQKQASKVAKTVPWRVVFFVVGLFLVVAAARDQGLGQQVADFLAGQDDSASGLTVITIASVVLANLINNLPAFLILAPPADPVQLDAVLVGVNAGPMLTPLGSLATVLWLHLLKQHGAATPKAGQILRIGIVAVPVVVAAGVIGLILR